MWQTFGSDPVRVTRGGIGLLTLGLFVGMLLSCLTADARWGEADPLRFETVALPDASVYVTIVPPDSPYRVMPAVSEHLAYVETFAKRHPRARVVLNGGYFDPQNEKTTSFITLQGRTVGNPAENQRLMENKALSGYLDRILNRSEFRTYRCQPSAREIRYDITPHLAPVPAGCSLLGALGAGPALLPSLNDLSEAFVDYANGKLIRDPIGGFAKNARSAVGVTKDGGVILMMAAQLPKGGSDTEDFAKSGLPLSRMADLMKTFGAEKALSLDGGSSASMFFKGKMVYGKLNAAGKPVKRQVKSVLLVTKPDQPDDPQSARSGHR